MNKVIIQRTKLRNMFLKIRTYDNKSKYNKQRHLCLRLLQEKQRIQQEKIL